MFAGGRGAGGKLTEALEDSLAVELGIRGIRNSGTHPGPGPAVLRGSRFDRPHKYEDPESKPS